MSKYDRFGDYLKSLKSSRVRLTFEEIEKKLDFSLPPSARFPAWWSNNATNSVMTKVWLAAGWRSKEVDTESGAVTFTRDPSASVEVGGALEVVGVNPVTISVLTVLAKRNGRSVAAEAGALLNETLSPGRPAAS